MSRGDQMCESKRICRIFALLLSLLLGFLSRGLPSVLNCSEQTCLRLGLFLASLLSLHSMRGADSVSSLDFSNLIENLSIMVEMISNNPVHQVHPYDTYRDCTQCGDYLYIHALSTLISANSFLRRRTWARNSSSRNLRTSCLP